jgi:hypothetical protein
MDEPHPLAAQIEWLRILTGHWRAVGQVVERNVAADRIEDNGSVGRVGQPQVHCPAFVRFHMSETDPPHAI